MTLELDRVKEEVKLRELEVKKIGRSKRAKEAAETEAKVMSGIVHKLGYELFKERHF